jgi:hypothetical protein
MSGCHDVTTCEIQDAMGEKPTFRPDLILGLSPTGPNPKTQKVLLLLITMAESLPNFWS